MMAAARTLSATAYQIVTGDKRNEIQNGRSEASERVAAAT